jgi:hypothetical protein
LTPAGAAVGSVIAEIRQLGLRQAGREHEQRDADHRVRQLA